jgi:hypothetical protein
VNWSSELPTKAGFFAWKPCDDGEVTPHVVFENPLGVLCVWDEYGDLPVVDLAGLWCPLVPADECVPKKWLEEAWMEGWESGEGPQALWNESLAKRRMEGVV